MEESVTADLGQDRVEISSYAHRRIGKGRVDALQLLPVIPHYHVRILKQVSGQDSTHDLFLVDHTAAR